ncbi:methyl-accepting chemotaxis protein [Parachlamydia acanthamoebae]|uniref:methyl-accepting chemotaxis protein n=1 Tax=Parachlamydia acanthamoebae TaxID=83552 RepID=UPI0007513BDC|nr:methyl-accepting chemotaxis protein [Parachlamydia acanthamoebae]
MMLSKLTAWMNNIQGKFTYHQRFWFFFFVYLFFMPIPAYLMITAQNYLIHGTKKQIIGYQYVPVMQTLLNNIAETWIFYLASSNSETQEKHFKEDLLEVTSKAIAQLKNVQKAHPSSNFLDHLGKGFSDSRKVEMDFDAWEKAWKQLIEIKPARTQDERNALTSELFQSLLSRYSDIKDAYGISSDSNAWINKMGYLLFETLPKNGIFITEFFGGHLKKSVPLTLNELLVAQKIQSNIKQINPLLNDPTFLKLKDDQVKDALKDYFQAIEDLVYQINTSKYENIYSKDLRSKVVNTLESALTLEKISHEKIIQALTTQLNTYQMQQYFALAYWFICSLILTIFAITRSFTRHLFKILRHLQRLAKGDVALTPDSDSRDEFGQIGHAVNQMVESVQSIVYKLQELGKKLQSFTEEMTWSTKAQEQTISSQERSIKSIDSKAQQIALESRHLADTMKALSLASRQTSLAKNAHTGLERLKDKIPVLVDASSKISEVLQSIEGKVKDTSRLLSFITSISDEADTLFLNAAIETESAGEHKQSFAEFTKQIQRFANNTQEATANILQIINKVSLHVSVVKQDVHYGLDEILSGANRIKTVSSQLSDITQHVEKQVVKFENVSQVMQQQAGDAEGIIGAISGLLESTKKNLPIVHELDETISQLNSAADELQKALHFFFHNPKKTYEIT